MKHINKLFVLVSIGFILLFAACDKREYEIPTIMDVHKYHFVRSAIENETVIVYTKKEVEENKIMETSSNGKQIDFEFNDIDYVIITALEEDEMSQILPLIKKEGVIENVKHFIEYGYFVDKPEKKVAYVSQLSTGMVDASILASEMLVKFKPKFLIMPGVMGGKPKDTNIGDVIVSTKVFTIDKGKLTAKE